MKPSAPIYTAGTLQYDKKALIVLFFWLMWNDFSLMFIEQLNSLTRFIMRDHGATLTEMAELGMASGLIVPFINPIVSTWSDRHRGRYGRRRPFLFWSTPFFAFFLALTPYMPTLYHFFLRYSWFTSGVVPHLPMKGDLIFMGISGFFCAISNAVVMAIFSYLYFDVVPKSHMGRFQSLSKIALLLAGLVWGFFVLGFADRHMKTVFVVTASLMLVIYLVSTWRIKEGDYPPPDPHRKGGFVAPLRAYIVECFGQSYFLWIFAAHLLFQVGNNGGGVISYYLHYDLKLPLGTLGWAQGWGQSITSLFGLLFGFAVGAFTDRMKAVRLMAPLFVAWSAFYVFGYFFVDNKWGLLIFSSLGGLFDFAFGICFGVFTIETFPLEKVGQFCSAQAFTYQIFLCFMSPVIGSFWDRLNYFRGGYLWQGGFYLLAAIVYAKVYLNWKRRGGRAPVPHAG